MGRLAVFLCGLFLVSSAATVDASDDPYQPTDVHFQAIYECLEASRGSGPRAIEDGCVGIVSQPCLDKPENQSTHGMAGCVRREERIWDSLLNDWYTMAREALSKPVRGELRKVQRAWITWRDAKCGFERDRFEGGTMGIPIAANCMMETTARRALELRGLVDDLGSR